MDLLSLLQATVTLLLSLLLVPTISILMRSRRNKLNNNQIRMEAPEPKGAWPIIGHLHLLAGQTPVFRSLAALADRHGPIFTIRLGIRRALVVSSKEAMMECYNVNDRAFLSRPDSAALKHMGYGGAMVALGLHGQLWREFRKIVTHDLLSNRHLESMRHMRAAEVESGIKELYSTAVTDGTSIVDMTRWFRLVTMNLMLQTIAGKRYSPRDEESRRFARAMDKFMYLTGILELSDVIPGIEWLDLQGQVRSMKHNAEEMDYFMSKWLEEHVQSKEKGNQRDFMDVLLSLFPIDGRIVFGNKSENIIKGTALSLILGGSDTTTAAMIWALSLLLNHKKTLEKAQEEIDKQIGRERWVEESDIKNLAYLQAIVKETLRLYPPGPLLIPRESIEDCHVAGYFVPKGTRLIANVWKLHRDPLIWTDPDKFQPERFLSSHVKVDVRGKQFEYLPFSSGRRSCPGVTAALQMMHLMLARLLQGFNLATPKDGPVDMIEALGLSLPKATPLEVLLTPRLPSNIY